MLNQLYDLWLKEAVADPDLHRELTDIAGNETEISDRFYQELSFGTAGLRGKIGAGTNRMNIYTVGKATKGLAAYIHSQTQDGRVAIAYDSRIKSDLFARTAACLLAADGIKVYLYQELMPTPMLSFAVRYFHCDAGIVITASHNPAEYNGYKAYGPDGSQLSGEACEKVTAHMESIDPFADFHPVDFDTALADGRIEWIGQEVIDAYLDRVEACSVSHHDGVNHLNVIYTPLHGAGNKPVRAILDRIGVGHVTLVKEQELPDGHFPTAPYPNPEIRQPFEPALKLAETVHPDLLLATDPDCDRVGIAVACNEGYRLMSGNEVGALLLQYILECRTANGTLPTNPVAVKTIVSTQVCQKIADRYGCQLINVLTGFKYIGEQITLLEEKGEESRFVFGFEESYGYLSGSHVRDKDAVVASMLICEMTAYYKKQGKDLTQVLDDIYKTYGYYGSAQRSFTFEGQSGLVKMANILDNLRGNPLPSFCNDTVVSVDDYEMSRSTDCVSGVQTVLTLPKSNVLVYTLASGGSLIIRPSGTEPKIKFYLNAVGTDEADCRRKLTAMSQACAALTE